MLVTARRHFTSVYDSEVNGIGTRVVYRFLPMKFVLVLLLLLLLLLLVTRSRRRRMERQRGEKGEQRATKEGTMEFAGALFEHLVQSTRVLRASSSSSSASLGHSIEPQLFKLFL